jgi:hypothetical protein
VPTRFIPHSGSSLNRLQQPRPEVFSTGNVTLPTLIALRNCLVRSIRRTKSTVGRTLLRHSLPTPAIPLMPAQRISRLHDLFDRHRTHPGHHDGRQLVEDRIKRDGAEATRLQLRCRHRVRKRLVSWPFRAGSPPGFRSRHGFQPALPCFRGNAALKCKFNYLTLKANSGCFAPLTSNICEEINPAVSPAAGPNAVRALSSKTITGRAMCAKPRAGGSNPKETLLNFDEPRPTGQKRRVHDHTSPGNTPPSISTVCSQSTVPDRDRMFTVRIRSLIPTHFAVRPKPLLCGSQRAAPNMRRRRAACARGPTSEPRSDRH